MKTLLLAATALIALSGAAHAQRQSGITGQKLVQLCTSDPKSVEGCTAFIDGVADTAYFYQTLRPANGSKGGPLPAYLCVPPTTTGPQLRDIVVQFVQKKPEQSTREASGVVLRALDASFRCQKKAGTE